MPSHTSQLELCDVCLQVMAYNAMHGSQSQEQEQELRDRFEAFDMDGNGYISATDFFLYMHTMGLELGVREIEELFEVVDVDGDGQVLFPQIYGRSQSIPPTAPLPLLF